MYRHRDKDSDRQQTDIRRDKDRQIHNTSMHNTFYCLIYILHCYGKIIKKEMSSKRCIEISL